MKFLSNIPLAALFVLAPLVRSERIREEPSGTNAGLRGDSVHTATATRSRGPGSSSSSSCSGEKKVWLKGFCIKGNHDDGDNGEHRLYLGDGYVTSTKMDYEENKCHYQLDHNQPKVIGAWNSLMVGTTEHDTDPGEVNEDYMVDLSANMWYDETCDAYDVVVSIQFANGNGVMACYESREGDHPPNLGIPRCQNPIQPHDYAFTFFLEIKPNTVTHHPPQQPSRVGCSKEKWIWMYGFCINGDHDTGDNGEHRLWLDDGYVTSDEREYREHECHYDLEHNQPKIVGKKRLEVGTSEFDNNMNDGDYFAELYDDEWYDDTCDTYHVAVSIKFVNGNAASGCYEANGGNHPPSLNLPFCHSNHHESPTSDAFTFYLQVKPARVDFPPGWTDSEGDGCEWYESACGDYGHDYESGGYTANEACAICGGGVAEGPP